MKIILLTRRSAFQIYCANKLANKGLLDCVIVEEGSSFATTKRKYPTAFTRKLQRRLATLLKNTIRDPLYPIETIRFYKNRNKYFGFGMQDLFNKRILKHDYHDFSSSLVVEETVNINSEETLSLLESQQPDLVLVFGTRMIKRNIFECLSSPFINMHWGISPSYRGEGIVSALAIGGPKDLGVTVHHLSTLSDAGDILFQATPDVSYEDNFYSIGLKLSLLGTSLFERVVNEYLTKGAPKGYPQDLSKGFLYDTKYMENHLELYQQAWAMIKKESLSPHPPSNAGT